jgi:nitroreductase
MELDEVLRRRRMVRAFEPRPVPAGTVERLVDAARRAPAAGNTHGLAVVALEGPEETARYWDVALPAERRADFPWPKLLDAPVLLVLCCRPGAWVERYAETDKDRTGLGAGTDAWDVPYWFVDTAFAAMLAQLAAVDAGLGALFFGLFEHERPVLDALGVPASWRAVGTIAVGWPAQDDRPSRSAARGRPPLDEVLHRGGWQP